jgi:hypothetical protein
VSDERYVLSGPVREICDVLGLPFHRTMRLTLEPSRVEAVVARERDGAVYLQDDEPVIATDTLVFKVRT